eukprot:scaffold19217_cov103-Skeletonema_dohrnii-CCMP3373.AAC.3
MADHAIEGDIFVYMGGQAPQHVVNVIIDESVSEIDEHAFSRCPHLQSVTFHDGVSRVKKRAFCPCRRLRQIIMPGVEVIETHAFASCFRLRFVVMPSVRVLEEKAFNHCYSVDVLDLPMLEETSFRTFEGCRSLRRITMPSIKTIGGGTFFGCEQLVELDFPEGLEQIGICAAIGCNNLRHISIPLKSDMLMDNGENYYWQFRYCIRLTTVDLVGGLHTTISSLHLERWKNEMKEEINRINLILPSDAGDKAFTIQRWIESVIRKMESCTVGHQTLLMEATTLLELALWKVKLDEIEEGDDTCTRNELRVTSGASIIVKNVLQFLRLA